MLHKRQIGRIQGGVWMDRVSTFSIIQANLQHSIAASRIITKTVKINRGIVRTVSGAWIFQVIPCTLWEERIDLGMYPCEKHEHTGSTRILLYGPSSSPSKVFWGWGRKTTGCLFRLSTIWFQGSSPVKGAGGTCAILWEWKSLFNCAVWLQHTSYYNDRGEALVEFLNSLNLELFNQGNEPTFCSGYRQEVIDITLGSFGLLESIAGWGVSLEPSPSDRGHIFSLYRAHPLIKA
jgi:hypothetical protein